MSKENKEEYKEVISRERKIVSQIKNGTKQEYDPEYHVPLIASFSRRGCTVEQIAKKLGVTFQTIYVWISEHDEIRQAVRDGKDFCVAEIEGAMLRSAKGHEVVDRVEVKGYSATKGAYREEKTTVKSIAPNVIAQIFWLKNQAPDIWKDKREVESKETKELSWTETRQYVKPEYAGQFDTPETAAKEIEENFEN